MTTPIQVFDMDVEPTFVFRDFTFVFGGDGSKQVR